MKATKIEVTLNKIGTAKLETPLTDTVLVPLGDSRKSWLALFDGQWPKGKGIMDKVELTDVLETGLVTLARRQVTKRLIDGYREEHPSSGKRGRGAKREVVEL